jgi:hypothetical protein
MIKGHNRRGFEINVNLEELGSQDMIRKKLLRLSPMGGFGVIVATTMLVVLTSSCSPY